MHTDYVIRFLALKGNARYRQGCSHPPIPPRWPWRTPVSRGPNSKLPPTWALALFIWLAECQVEWLLGTAWELLLLPTHTQKSAYLPLMICTTLQVSHKWRCIAHWISSHLISYSFFSIYFTWHHLLSNSEIWKHLLSRMCTTGSSSDRQLHLSPSPLPRPRFWAYPFWVLSHSLL